MRHPTISSYGLALVLGATMSVCLMGIPVQLSDCFGNLLGLQGVSLGELVTGQLLSGGTYLRPFLTATLKVAYEVADGHYYLWFRSLQALQVVILLILFVRMLRVRGFADAAALPVALAVLVGLHTFAGVVREGFPINTFLTILLCCTAAATIGQARPRIANDIAAVVLLTFAMLTVETGLLVWVIFVVGYAAGDRGLSRGGVVAVTVCLTGYFVLRFGVTSGTVPHLDERSTGFGFATYSPDQLTEMFGESPLYLYAYNVASAICCVLFGEPRGGVWRFVQELTTGQVEPWRLVSVITSTGTSILIARYALQRFTRWIRGEIDAPDRLVILFLALLPANAVFTYAYLKDVILSPVGVFYAGAAYVAFSSLATEIGRAPVRPAGGAMRRVLSRRAMLGFAMLILACGWSMRMVGIHYSLRQVAPVVRNEWAYYADGRNRPPVLLGTPEAEQLWQTLYDDAIWRTPQPPIVSLRWANQWFDPTQ